MKLLSTKIKFGAFSAVLFFGLLLFFGMFMPMKSQLEESIIKNYGQLASSKYQSLMYVVEKSVDGAESISSRTTIRNNIISYRNQDIELNELKELTQSKYEDGAKVLDYLVTAERFVNGTSVARVVEQEFVDYQYSVNQVLNDGVNTTFDFWQGHVLLQVISPIIDKTEVLGYDYLLYDLTEILGLLSDETYQIAIEEGNMVNGEQNKNSIYTRNNLKICEKNDDVIAVMGLNTDKVFRVVTKKTDLYRDLNQLIIREVILWASIFILLFVLTYLFVFRVADQKIQQIQKSRDEYKGMAYKDNLTGAYSKAFVNVWNEKLRMDAQYYTMVVVDIDDFKAVNDQHGHLMGDEALINVSKAIHEATRQGDYIIRFGGDEFLILFKNIKEKHAYDIMDRIEENIKKINQLNFDISISYGISIIAAHDSFKDQFCIADKRMYANKKQKA